MVLKLRVQQIDLTDGTSGHWFTRAHICASSPGTDSDGSVLLSADCRSANEIAEEADGMIKELENIKRQAKRVDWTG